MSSIFISHSSANDAAVTDLSRWLRAAEFKDHFVDHLHIPGGADWNHILPQRLAQADILLLYVTRDWLASIECFSEYRAAYYANRPIIPLLIADTLHDLSEEEAKRFKALCSSVQGVPFNQIPPDALTEKLMRGSLELATATLRKRRREKLIKRASFFAALLFVTLAGLAMHFRDYLGAYVDRLRIAQAFEPLSPEDLAEFSQVEDLPLAQRVFRECRDVSFCPDMIALPPGRFRMGSTVDPLADNDDPNPSEMSVHSITVPKGLSVSVSEVTQAQWLKCFVSTRLEKGPKCKEIPVFSEQENYPVASVSWRDAKAYVAWLNTRIVGRPDGPYRLLSEAEWEYAARGVTRLSEPHTLYSWGNELEPEVCRYANALNAKMPEMLAIERRGVDCPNNSVMMSAVILLEPNAFNVYDTAGNVAEWVEDCWHDSHEGRPEDASAWTTGAGSECDRVLKGGSWFGEVDNLRPAARIRLKDDLFGFNIGFRIARDLNWRPDT